MTASSTVVPAPRTARLNEFWRWWTGELRALVPSRVVGWVVGEVAVTDVVVDDVSIRLLGVESGKPRVFAEVPIAEIAAHPRFREMRAKGNDHVRVILSSGQVLLKTITLPAAIEENLREVMGFELDKHTPFTASQAYYDVKLLRRDAQRESIDVILAAAARATVDPLLVTLRQAGLSVDAITVADIDAGGQSMELLPASEKPARKWGQLLKLNLALLGLAVALGLLALLLPIWQKREQVIELSPLVGKASAEFEINQRVFDEYTKLANEYNYITGKKESQHPSLAILEELTRISPDTTFVQSLEMKSSPKTREITLTGEAQAASRVIEVLEQSPMFQNASQKSPTRRGSLGTNEWFNIATELKPKALPAAVVQDGKIPEVVPPAPALVAPPVSVPAPIPVQTPALPVAPQTMPGKMAPANAASPVGALDKPQQPAPQPTATVTVPAPKPAPVDVPPKAASTPGKQP
ncbi:MAG: PilN domain-containing protein [Betaproteobacteria bacterium]